MVRVRGQGRWSAALNASVIVGGVTQTGHRTRGPASMPKTGGGSKPDCMRDLGGSKNPSRKERAVRGTGPRLPSARTAPLWAKTPGVRRQLPHGLPPGRRRRP
ncbi:hypothetical protein DAETH_43960 (plasmid) [Deinococcus aetherius]|uniref:Uncharacterized protein n=1 Tax=Deinococcus aetherius TaxID=200252 RepID=A0ABN6RM86_9DEIO|nr:hypothetical protein DAETH_43960 [Deinococcus aetherius]